MKNSMTFLGFWIMTIESSDLIDEFDSVELRSIKIFSYSNTTPCDELDWSLGGSYVANAPVPMMSPR